LIGNAWIQVATLDPDTGRLWQFDTRTETMVPWQGQITPLSRVEDSPAWYQGLKDPLPPAFLERPVRSAAYV
jgi:hypothetical protein